MNLAKTKETNTYIIIYAAVMVIIVAFLLAFISSVLKPTQDANVLRDTKKQILTSLNIVGLSGDAIDRKYDEPAWVPASRSVGSRSSSMVSPSSLTIHSRWHSLS